MFDINLWIGAVTKPKETFTAEKSKASLVPAIVNYVIAGIISGIFGFLLSAVTGGGFGGAIGLVTAPIFTVVFSLIGAAIIWIIAKILGGKGSYSSLYYLGSLYAVPLAVVSWIPIVGILVGLYSLYLLYLVLMISQELSSGKALAIILLLVVIAVILAIIMAVLVGAALLTMFGALGAANPSGYFGLG